MENEPNFQVLITSNEQVATAYPEIFEELHIDIIPIHIEKNHEQIDHSTEPRIILIPSGIISVISKNNQDFIWGDCQTEEYENFLMELNKKTREWSIENTKGNTLSHQEMINGKKHIIKIFPYQDIDAGKVLIDSIESKLKVLESLKNL
jgi:hypothetical protein